MTDDSVVARALFVLGVAPGGSPAEIKTAYRTLVQRWHPDRFANDPVGQADATRRLAAINAAFGTLRDAAWMWETEAQQGIVSSMPTQPIAPPSGRLTAEQVNGLVAAIVRGRSFSQERTDPWKRAAFFLAAGWVVFVALVSWIGAGDEVFGDSVGRAMAPVGALTTVAIPLAMIWFGTAIYRALGWMFLLFFVLALPAFRIFLWSRS